jgi:amino acid transporter
MMVGKTIVMTYEPFDNNELVLKYLKYPVPLGACVFLLFRCITGKRKMENKFNDAISFWFLIFALVLIISSMIIDTSQPFDNNELALEYLKYSLILAIIVYMGILLSFKGYLKLKEKIEAHNEAQKNGQSQSG